MPIVVGHEAIKNNQVTCKNSNCRAILVYDCKEVFETYKDTGPYEVDCPRTCVVCPCCKTYVDVP